MAGAAGGSRARISIVSATLNRRDMLRRAIESAMAQGSDDVEHIVVDGASTDGTLEMLRAFPHLRVVSEPDRCLYEGWNKGIRLAAGDWICILNSDDELPPGAFDEVRRLAALHPEADVISGSVEIKRGIDGRPASVHLIDDAAMIRLREQDIGPGITLTNARYISRRLIERI
ncbi:MAG: glycosyltransferase, partial [Hyphomicrobiaceae bacterium]